MTYRKLLAGNPNIRYLWLGQVVSEVGDWLNNVAVLAMALELAGTGRQGLAIAVYAIARHLPLFVFGPLAGVVVDRIRRKRVLIGADLIRAVLALGFLVANHYAKLWMIYAFGAAMFSVSAFFNAAKRASVPNLTRGFDELLGANSLTTSTTAATIAAGSAVGGLIATVGGRQSVFILNAVTFLLSAYLVSRIVFPRNCETSTDATNREKGTRRLGFGKILARSVDEFRQGLKYIQRDRLLRLIFIVAGVWGLGNGTARALYSIFGSRLGLAAVTGRIAHASEFGIAALFVAMGIGGVLGAPLARRLSAGRSLGFRFGRSLLFDGFGLFLFSLMPNLWTAMAVLVAREMNFAIWWTSQQTLVMSHTDNHFAGRVFATFETVTTLTMVGSMMAAGIAADRFGISPVAAIGGLLIIMAGAIWFLFDPNRDGAVPRAAETV